MARKIDVARDELLAAMANALQWVLVRSGGHCAEYQEEAQRLRDLRMKFWRLIPREPKGPEPDASTAFAHTRDRWVLADGYPVPRDKFAMVMRVKPSLHAESLELCLPETEWKQHGVGRYRLVLEKL